MANIGEQIHNLGRKAQDTKDVWVGSPETRDEDHLRSQVDEVQATATKQVADLAKLPDPTTDLASMTCAVVIGKYDRIITEIDALMPEEPVEAQEMEVDEESEGGVENDGTNGEPNVEDFEKETGEIIAMLIRRAQIESRVARERVKDGLLRAQSTEKSKKVEANADDMLRTDACIKLILTTEEAQIEQSGEAVVQPNSTPVNRKDVLCARLHITPETYEAVEKAKDDFIPGTDAKIQAWREKSAGVQAAVQKRESQTRKKKRVEQRLARHEAEVGPRRKRIVELRTYATDKRENYRKRATELLKSKRAKVAETLSLPISDQRVRNLVGSNATVPPELAGITMMSLQAENGDLANTYQQQIDDIRKLWDGAVDLGNGINGDVVYQIDALLKTRRHAQTWEGRVDKLPASVVNATSLDQHFGDKRREADAELLVAIREVAHKAGCKEPIDEDIQDIVGDRAVVPGLRALDNRLKDERVKMQQVIVQGNSIGEYIGQCTEQSNALRRALTQYDDKLRNLDSAYTPPQEPPTTSTQYEGTHAVEEAKARIDAVREAIAKVLHLEGSSRPSVVAGVTKENSKGEVQDDHETQPHLQAYDEAHKAYWRAISTRDIQDFNNARYLAQVAQEMAEEQSDSVTLSKCDVLIEANNIQIELLGGEDAVSGTRPPEPLRPLDPEFLRNGSLLSGVAPHSTPPSDAGRAGGSSPDGGGGGEPKDSIVDEAIGLKERQNHFESIMYITLPLEDETLETNFYVGPRQYLQIGEHIAKIGTGKGQQTERPIINLYFDNFQAGRDKSVYLDSLIKQQSIAIDSPIEIDDTHSFTWRAERDGNVKTKTDENGKEITNMTVRIVCDVTTKATESDESASSEMEESERRETYDKVHTLWDRANAEDDRTRSISLLNEALVLARPLNDTAIEASLEDSILISEIVQQGDTLDNKITTISEAYAADSVIEEFLTQADALSPDIIKLYELELKNDPNRSSWRSLSALGSLYHMVMAGLVDSGRHRDVITVVSQELDTLRALADSVAKDRALQLPIAFLSDAYQAVDEWQSAIDANEENMALDRKLKPSEPPDKNDIARIEMLRGKLAKQEEEKKALIESLANNPTEIALGQAVTITAPRNAGNPINIPIAGEPGVSLLFAYDDGRTMYDLSICYGNNQITPYTVGAVTGSLNIQEMPSDNDPYNILGVPVAELVKINEKDMAIAARITLTLTKAEGVEEEVVVARATLLPAEIAVSGGELVPVVTGPVEINAGTLTKINELQGDAHKSDVIVNLLGITDPTLRRWTGRFSEFLPGLKAGKERRYTTEHARTLAKVQDLLEQGWTYEQVAEKLAHDPEVQKAVAQKGSAVVSASGGGETDTSTEMSSETRTNIQAEIDSLGLGEEMNDLLMKVAELGWNGTTIELKFAQKAGTLAEKLGIPFLSPAVEGFSHFLQGVLKMREGENMKQRWDIAKPDLIKWLGSSIDGGLDLASLAGGPEVGAAAQSLQAIKNHVGNWEQAPDAREIAGLIVTAVAEKLKDVSPSDVSPEATLLRTIGHVLGHMASDSAELVKIGKDLVEKPTLADQIMRRFMPTAPEQGRPAPTEIPQPAEIIPPVGYESVKTEGNPMVTLYDPSARQSKQAFDVSHRNTMNVENDDIKWGLALDEWANRGDDDLLAVFLLSKENIPLTFAYIRADTPRVECIPQGNDAYRVVADVQKTQDGKYIITTELFRRQQAPEADQSRALTLTAAQVAAKLGISEDILKYLYDELKDKLNAKASTIGFVTTWMYSERDQNNLLKVQQALTRGESLDQAKAAIT